MGEKSRPLFKSAAGPCQAPCACPAGHGAPRFVVLTGGPGTGKTAVLELARQHFCRHVVVLEESASILFGGGFPRRGTIPGRKSAQRAIFHIQVELERMAREDDAPALVLCDRGTLDGLAYWPDTLETYERDLGISREAELVRYNTVLCLRPPPPRFYNHQNPLRVESAQQALEIGERIERAWAGHPRMFFIEAAEDFFVKARRALELITAEVPACCSRSVIEARADLVEPGPGTAVKRGA